MKKLCVLFVGNSYTYCNQMPKVLFAELASEVGYEVEVTQVTKGGYRLCQFADPTDEWGMQLREAIDGAHYDYAVLQEQSLNPITNETQFLDGVRDVMTLISADQFVLYATWGRNDGSPDLKRLGLTCEEMTEGLSAAYNKAGQLFGARVAEVGKAFLAYAEEHTRDALYIEDNSHPSQIGSAIAARVILESMIG